MSFLGVRKKTGYVSSEKLIHLYLHLYTYTLYKKGEIKNEKNRFNNTPKNNTRPTETNI